MYNANSAIINLIGSFEPNAMYIGISRGSFAMLEGVLTPPRPPDTGAQYQCQHASQEEQEKGPIPWDTSVSQQVRGREKGLTDSRGGCGLTCLGVWSEVGVSIEIQSYTGAY